MSPLLFLLSALLLLTSVALWGFLAMASWSDRQLAVAWREDQELKSTGLEHRPQFNQTFSQD